MNSQAGHGQVDYLKIVHQQACARGLKTESMQGNACCTASGAAASHCISSAWGEECMTQQSAWKEACPMACRHGVALRYFKT